MHVPYKQVEYVNMVSLIQLMVGVLLFRFSEGAGESFQKCRCTDRCLDVDCSRSGLRHVPHDLPHNIRRLNLNDNFIQVLENNTLERYGMLQELLLGRNVISYIESDAFWNQTDLEVLVLSENNVTNITAQFRPELLKNLVSLKKLDIRNNMKKILESEFYYPDDALSLMVDLSILYMDLTCNPIFGTGFLKLTNVTILAFDVCHLTAMRNLTFIHFTDNLKELHMMKCHFVQHVEFGFLAPFKNLKVLNLADTYVHLSRALHLLYPLVNTKMDVINFQHVSYELLDSDKLPYTLVVTSDMMKYLQTICVKTLNLADNGIVDFQKHSLMTYDHPECFINLVLSANRFTFHIGRKVGEALTLASRAVNLKLFDFSYNPIRFTNETYLKVPNGELTFDPKSTGCSSESHGLLANVSITLPPKLQTIRFSHFVRQSCGDSVVIKTTPSLRYLDMSYYQFQKFPDLYIEGENNLETLNMSGVDSSLYVTKEHIPLFTNVRNAYFRHVELGKSAINSKHLLRIIPSVEILDISYNSIWTLPVSLFNRNANLKNLDLSHNMLHEVPKAIMKIPNLETLDLGFNNLWTISNDITDWLNKIATKGNITINLAGNVFFCTCDNKRFLRWLHETKVLFYQNKNKNFSCKLANGSISWTASANFHDLFSDCGAEKWIKVGISLLVSFVVIVVIVATLFNFRWRLAYFIYRKFRIMVEYKLNLKYVYDGYISYADDSDEWVKNFLAKKAEKTWGLRLFIDDRDISGGRSLIDGIADGIGSSRHVIFVLTSGLLDRELTAYEIERAKFEKVNNHVQITVLNLGIDINQVPQEFSSIWHDVYLIEWNDIPTFSDVSWGKLKVKLMLNR